MVLDKILKACCSDGSPFIPGKEDTHDEVEKPQKTQTAPVANNKIKFGNKKKEEMEVEEREASASTEAKNSGTTKYSGKATKYEDVLWDDMPKSAQEAATKLGFDKESWDSGEGWPESEDKWWEDLTEEEQAAATELGWDITSWDTKYEDKNFDELDETVKEVALAMGFTKEMWDDDEWPESLGYWADLTPEQRAYAHVLGYTNQWKWDG